MGITRHFLGWDRPCLHAVVDHLVDRYTRGGVLELRGVTLLMPVARAWRRLRELLVERVEKEGLRWSVPRFGTVGQIAELLCPSTQQLADDPTRWFAWAGAMREVGPEATEALLPHPPSQDDLAAWLGWARVLDSLHSDLAGECLGFEEAARAAEEMDRPEESSRWHAAAAVYSTYLRRLAALGVSDPWEARLGVLRRGECKAPGPILLVASDLRRSQCRMLEQVAEHITSLIFAPPELSDRFDGFGVVNPASWLDAPLGIRDDHLEVVEQPTDQAGAVVRAIAALQGRYSADQISVGVPDATLGPSLAQHLREWELPVRDPAGVATRRSGPCRLIAAVADYVEHHRFADLAALVRHPDAERWLRSELGEADGLTPLDRYYVQHMQDRLSGPFLGDNPDRLARVHAWVERLTVEVSGPGRSPGEWAEPIARVLAKIYGGTALDPCDEPQRIILRSCEQIAAVLQTLRGVRPESGPPLEGPTAIRIALDMLDGKTIDAEIREPAVEMLGWLDLALDDAPVLIVTGFNEGRVPGSLSADPFLPNSLRSRLGMTDNERRYARDAYLLSAILASRPHVKLIAGRWSVEGEPLAPSRLALVCEGPTVARRVLDFYKPSGPALARASRLRPAARGFAVPPPLPIPVQPIGQLRVTAFRDYLACPYRFYLRHVLKLRHLDDAAMELDGGAFGDLAHLVLSGFRDSPAAASPDPLAVQLAFDRLLDAQVLARLGESPPPAVRVQVEQLRARLHALARHQARHAAEGWRIVDVEKEYGGPNALLDVDGQPMQLIGVIDRIDINERTGEYAVLDYKTGEKGQEPDTVHRNKAGEWTDLQLPLYCLLVRASGVTAPIRPGYILLPGEEADEGFCFAPWTAEELSEAQERARQVVRDIREGRFEMSSEPPKADDFAAICGVENLVAAMAAEADVE